MRVLGWFLIYLALTTLGVGMRQSADLWMIYALLAVTFLTGGVAILRRKRK